MKTHTLVIVESPTKARTIGKFLGSRYAVESSHGHLRDLPKSKIGIDVARNFEPQYVVPAKSRSRVAALKKEAGKADEVILATDEDREGESIAWHLVQALGLENKNEKIAQPKSKTRNPASGVKRIVFHEITKPAIERALAHPRDIDMNLVSSQQARRVMDRLVGYKLSPFLWGKIARGLSAGRVQSVALRLVVEREEEIQQFNPREYWTIEAVLSSPDHPGASFTAELSAINGTPLEKLSLGDEHRAGELARELERSSYRIAAVEKKELKRNPLPPFTTSTLEQTAAARLGFSSKKTMFLAQGLYEKGHITYMRTDSVNLSEEALAKAAAWVRANLPPPYRLPAPRRFTTSSRLAQEAHEAIRPTDPGHPTSSPKIPRDEARLYDLIWRRFLASQLPPAEFDATRIEVEASSPSKNSYALVATGTTLKFDGFLKLWPAKFEEKELPPLDKRDAVRCEAVNPLQHFTEPPPRYSEATLIKTLEKFGIGRPSTYAPILSVIQERKYVEKVQGRFHPTEIGTLVSRVLTEHFPKIVDIQFTANMEEELDEIAGGKKLWQDVVREFYGPFAENLAAKEAEVERQVQESDTPCPHCGRKMIVKFGRFGKFLACPEPGSKVALPLPEEAEKIKALEEQTKDERCPVCGKPMAVKRGRFGYFLGCTDYPNCKGVSKIWNKTGFKCPACREDAARRDKPGDVVERKSRGRGNRVFYGCNRFPACTFVTNKKPESEMELASAFEHWKNNPPKPRKSYGRKKKEPSPHAARER